jgi:hypothetical protein
MMRARRCITQRCCASSSGSSSKGSNNAGRWWIGREGVDRTDDAPALRSDVTALDSVYFGGLTWTRLAGTLCAQEVAPRAAAQADAISAEAPHPAAPRFFDGAWNRGSPRDGDYDRSLLSACNVANGMSQRPRMDQCAALISQLAIRHRAGNAYRVLLGKGLEALSAVREGLGNDSAEVRFRCCQFLDHFLTPEILDQLIDMLEDPDHRVRRTTLHTLACDRCKEDSCRPDETRVLPRAITILAGDPDPHVRAMAVEVVGRSVHRHSEAEVALLHAQRSDPSPTVRKKARWYVPGGPIHRRTAPKIRQVGESPAPSTHRSAIPLR